MIEFTPLEVSAWIKKLSPNFKDALTPFGLFCVPFYHQIRVNEPLLPAATEFWILTRYVFQFNGMELCPTLEEFGTIMGEPDLGAIILPIDEEYLSNLAHQFLMVPLAMAKRWCTLDKLNVHMVFKYFSQQDVPLAGVKHFQYLNAFCLCILARYFLVHETPHVDPRILHVVNNLGRGSPIIIILAETLNG